MVMRVQQIGEKYHIVLTPEAMEALHLTDGSEVEVRLSAALKPESRYATVEEGLAAFRSIEHMHRDTLRELAK